MPPAFLSPKSEMAVSTRFCKLRKTKVNEGEIPQYYVEDNHEAIIDPEVFEMVQREMAKRGKGTAPPGRRLYHGIL